MLAWRINYATNKTQTPGRPRQPLLVRQAGQAGWIKVTPTLLPQHAGRQYETLGH